MHLVRTPPRLARGAEQPPLSGHVARGVRRAPAVAVLIASVLAAVLLGGAPAAASRPAAAGAPDAHSWPAVEDVAADVDRYLREQVEQGHLPGAATAIVQDGHVVWAAGYGSADGRGRSMTPTTPVLLASTSKALTAIAVMQQAETGRLDLDGPVVTYLPWFRVQGPAEDPEAAARITPRHLLHHTAGLTANADIGAYVREDTDGDALERRVRRLADVSLAASPGASFAYSNAAYDVLGLLVQTVSGQPYGHYLTDHVLTPLGMSNAHTTRTDARADGLAAGHYRWFGRWWRPTPMPTGQQGTPSFATFASARDLARLVAAHMTTQPRNVLSGQGWNQLSAPGAPVDAFRAYAGGWFVRPMWEALHPEQPDGREYDLPVLLEHEGSWGNTHTYMAHVPDRARGIAVVVPGNDPARESRLAGIDANLLRLLAGRDPLPLTITEEPLERYGWLVAALGLLTELGSLAWTARRLRSRGPAAGTLPLRTVGITGALLLLDAAVLWLALVHVPAHFLVAPVELVRFTPDIGLTTVASVLVAAVSALLKIVLLGSAALAGARQRGPAHAATQLPPLVTPSRALHERE